jgi:hypothetical protein
MYAKAIVPRKLPKLYHYDTTVFMYQLVRVEEGTGGGVGVSEVLGYSVHTYSGGSSPFTYTVHLMQAVPPSLNAHTVPYLFT